MFCIPLWNERLNRDRRWGKAKYLFYSNRFFFDTFCRAAIEAFAFEQEGKRWRRRGDDEEHVDDDVETLKLYTPREIQEIYSQLKIAFLCREEMEKISKKS